MFARIGVMRARSERPPLGKAEAGEGSIARVLRPMWRQLDWDMSGGAHHNRAPVAGVALEHFQNQKKLLSKHGRKPRSELTTDAAKRNMIASWRRYFRGRVSNPQQQPFTESPRPSLVNASQ